MIQNINHYNFYKDKYKKKVIINSDGSCSNSEYLFKGNKKLFFWVHGFNDYYYHYHIGNKLLDESYDIYSIRLRRYDGSEYLFYTNDLKEYIEDIDKHLECIINNYKEIVLYGHSLGGLISTLYLKYGKYNNKISFLVLNSPFFEFRVNFFEKILIKYLVFIFDFLIYLGFLDKFVIAYHKGENVYNNYIFKKYFFDKKLKVSEKPVYLDWVITVSYYQKLISKYIFTTPTLVLCPSNSCNEEDLIDNNYGDSVLNVSDMVSISNKIFKNLELKMVNDSIHDIFVSNKEVVDYSFYYMIKWLKNSKKYKFDYTCNSISFFEYFLFYFNYLVLLFLFILYFYNYNG